MERALERLAEQILGFDEASLASLREKYRLRIEHFDGTRGWERSVIIFCIINAVSMKNTLFNEKLLGQKKKKADPPPVPGRIPPKLRRVK